MGKIKKSIDKCVEKYNIKKVDKVIDEFFKNSDKYPDVTIKYFDYNHSGLGDIEDVSKKIATYPKAFRYIFEKIKKKTMMIIQI